MRRIGQIGLGQNLAPDPLDRLQPCVARPDQVTDAKILDLGGAACDLDPVAGGKAGDHRFDIAEVQRAAIAEGDGAVLRVAAVVQDRRPGIAKKQRIVVVATFAAVEIVLVNQLTRGRYNVAEMRVIARAAVQRIAPPDRRAGGRRQIRWR